MNVSKTKDFINRLKFSVKVTVIIGAAYLISGCSEDEPTPDRFAGVWYFESYSIPAYFSFEIKKNGSEYEAVGVSSPNHTITLSGRSESGFEAIRIQNVDDDITLTGLTFSDDKNKLVIGDLNLTRKGINYQSGNQIIKKITNRN
jgi:hypothetical protein